MCVEEFLRTGKELGSFCPHYIQVFEMSAEPVDVPAPTLGPPMAAQVVGEDRVPSRSKNPYKVSVPTCVIAETMHENDPAALTGCPP